MERSWTSSFILNNLLLTKTFDIGSEESEKPFSRIAFRYYNLNIGNIRNFLKENETKGKFTFHNAGEKMATFSLRWGFECLCCGKRSVYIGKERWILHSLNWLVIIAIRFDHWQHRRNEISNFFFWRWTNNY